MDVVIGHPVKMLVKFLELRGIQLEDGQTVIKLHIKEHQAINVFILFLQQSINLKIVKLELNKMLFIVEFLLQNKKMIFKDNAYILVVNIQIIKLLKTLDQDLITKDLVFLNYWKCLINNNSMKWLSLARTDFVDSDLNLSNGNSYKTIQKSWFSIKKIKHQNKNSLRIFLPFYKYLLAGGMVKENTQMEPLLRMEKIKLKLNSIQIKTLQMWNYHHRYTYNKTISLLNEDNERPLYKDVKPENSNTYYSKLELRNLIVPESCCSRIKWILETPKAIRESAVFESYKNLQSAISNLKNGHIRYFNLRYKSKKLLKWTIGVPKESIKVYQNGDLGIYEERTTNFRLRTTEKIKEIKNDCTIHFNGLHYYICVPKAIEMKNNNKSNWMCSLDPGIRKFQTIYSPDNDNYITIGEKASRVLYVNLLRLDKLLSKKNSKNILKIKKLRLRIQYLQDELHYKSINFLCTNYKNIYIPKLTKENDIIKCSNRIISSKTVRNMVVLGHCKFIERLKTKAKEFTNVKIHIITEEYTSQRCLACNTFTKTNAEMFICKSCNFTIDRDILGSTNILLKNW